MRHTIKWMMLVLLTLLISVGSYAQRSKESLEKEINLYAVNTGDAPVDIELPFPASDVRLAPGEIRLFTSPTWRLPPEARIEGDTLVVEIPQDATPEARKAHCILPLDLSRELADGHGALVSVRVSAEGVSKPDLPWNGVKCMLHFIDAESGAARWPGAGLPQVKAFTNLLAQTRIGPLDLNGLPADHLYLRSGKYQDQCGVGYL